MKQTNRANLPDSIVKAVTNDPYAKGECDYSVTELLKPPRARALERQHADEISEDVSDRIWSLFGQVVHGILERSETKAHAEGRLYASFSGKVVGGGFDRFDVPLGLLQDFKVTSVWKVKDLTPPEEYVQQLNMLAALFRLNGKEVKTLQIVAILRDWSKMEARRDSQYPQAQVVTIGIPMWSQEESLAFIENRLRLHEEAKTTLPQCTSAERWARPDVYAVMKDGRKSAVKLHDNALSASTHASELGNGHGIIKRPGANVRCEAYCIAAPFCSQYKALKGNEG